MIESSGFEDGKEATAVHWLSSHAGSESPLLQDVGFHRRTHTHTHFRQRDPPLSWTLQVPVADALRVGGGGKGAVLHVSPKRGEHPRQDDFGSWLVGWGRFGSFVISRSPWLRSSVCRIDGTANTCTNGRLEVFSAVSLRIATYLIFLQNEARVD